MPKEVQTVTAFLESDGQILILLRSPKVRTFQGIWGGVSGLIEKGRTPEEQVLTEIREETGLEASDIRLLKKGDSQIINDSSRDLKKIVYPFLFQVKKRDKVKINWEHTDFRWIDPDEIESFPTMPLLKETLERVMAWS